MEIIQTSGDILNIIIAISVLIFTGFICWLLFYLIASLRNLFKISQDLRENLERSKSLITLIKQKVNTTFSFMSLLEEGTEKVKNIVQNYKKTKTKKKYTKNKKGTTKKSKTKN